MAILALVPLEFRRKRDIVTWFSADDVVPGLSEEYTSVYICGQKKTPICYTSGPAAKLSVQPEEDMSLENGECPTFKVEVQDAAGNLTSGGKQTVLARVNWAPKISEEMAVAKLLPPIKVLHSVLEPKYCQVSVLSGDGLELQFSVLATPGPVTQMDCKFSGDSTCTVGQPHPSRIVISFTDKFGNQTP
ncbi:structural maintenance of chromosomes flexible hinge domain-containing protein 1, partial [Elysia marginata]